MTWSRDQGKKPRPTAVFYNSKHSKINIIIQAFPLLAESPGGFSWRIIARCDVTAWTCASVRSSPAVASPPEPVPACVPQAAQVKAKGCIFHRSTLIPAASAVCTTLMTAIIFKHRISCACLSEVTVRLHTPICVTSPYFDANQRFPPKGGARWPCSGWVSSTRCSYDEWDGKQLRG